MHDNIRTPKICLQVQTSYCFKQGLNKVSGLDTCPLANKSRKNCFLFTKMRYCFGTGFSNYVR